MLGGGCACGGNKTKEDMIEICSFFLFFKKNQQFIMQCSNAVHGYIIQEYYITKGVLGI